MNTTPDLKCPVHILAWAEQATVQRAVRKREAKTPLPDIALSLKQIWEGARHLIRSNNSLIEDLAPYTDFLRPLERWGRWKHLKVFNFVQLMVRNSADL